LQYLEGWGLGLRSTNKGVECWQGKGMEARGSTIIFVDKKKNPTKNELKK
jgi:hypothetical protein